MFQRQYLVPCIIFLVLQSTSAGQDSPCDNVLETFEGLLHNKWQLSSSQSVRSVWKRLLSDDVEVREKAKDEIGGGVSLIGIFEAGGSNLTESAKMFKRRLEYEDEGAFSSNAYVNMMISQLDAPTAKEVINAWRDCQRINNENRARVRFATTGDVTSEFILDFQYIGNAASDPDELVVSNFIIQGGTVPSDHELSEGSVIQRYGTVSVPVKRTSSKDFLTVGINFEDGQPGETFTIAPEAEEAMTGIATITINVSIGSGCGWDVPHGGATRVVKDDQSWGNRIESVELLTNPVQDFPEQMKMCEPSFVGNDLYLKLQCIPDCKPLDCYEVKIKVTYR